MMDVHKQLYSFAHFKVKMFMKKISDSDHDVRA